MMPLWTTATGPATCGCAVTAQLPFVERRLEISEFTDGTNDFDAAFVVNGYARRVVAPVLESPETIDQNRSSFLATDVADDSAHVSTLLDGSALCTRAAGSFIRKLCFDLSVG